MTTQVRKNGVARLQSYEEAWQRSGSSIDSKIGRNSCDQIGCTKVLRSTIESSSPPKKSVVDHRYPVETGDWSLDVPIWRLRRRQPLTLGHQYSHRNAETTIYGTKVAVWLLQLDSHMPWNAPRYFDDSFLVRQILSAQFNSRRAPFSNVSYVTWVIRIRDWLHFLNKHYQACYQTKQTGSSNQVKNFPPTWNSVRSEATAFTIVDNRVRKDSHAD